MSAGKQAGFFLGGGGRIPYHNILIAFRFFGKGNILLRRLFCLLSTYFLFLSGIVHN